MTRTCHLKIKSNSYSIGLSPSARARCRTCKADVAKGEIRIVTHAPVRPGRETYFVRHLTCVRVAQVQSIVSVHGCVENISTDGRIGSANTEAAHEYLKQLIAPTDELVQTDRRPPAFEGSLLLSMLKSPL